MTAEQWAVLRDELTVPAIESHCKLANCDGAADLGQKLFFEPALSATVDEVRQCSTGTIACSSCHDSNRWYVDTRYPNSGSRKASGNYTKRNSPSLVDLAYKPRTQIFTWGGKYASPGAVLELAITNAMETGQGSAAESATSSFYWADYNAVFGAPTNDAETFANLELAFDAYLDRLVSLDSPFDQWRDGDPTALPDNAQRGFAVFVGKGGCIDCHGGPMFSDFAYRNTGLAGTADNGRYDLTQDPDDLGMFVTPMLRNVAKTGPYMHDGSLATLGDVVEFYRRGGDPGGVGTRDPRIAPLDLTDDDAADLVAFLGSLTGQSVDSVLTHDTHVIQSCAH